MIRFALIAWELGGALAALAAPVKAPVQLQYRLAPNAAYAFQTVVRVDGTVTSPGDPPDTVSARIEMRHRVRVVSIDAKAGRLVLENRLFQLKLTNRGAVTSAAEAPAVTTVIDPTGKLLEVKGLDQLAAAQVIPGLDPATFSSLLYSLPTLPPHGIKPGDSWRDEVPVGLPNGRTAVAQRKLTLVAVATESPPSARIKMEMTLPIDITVPGAGGGKLTGTQTGSGESRISTLDGMPLDSANDLQMVVTAQPSARSAGAGSGAVHVTTRIRVESHRVPDDGAVPKASGTGSAPPPARGDGAASGGKPL